MYVLYGIVSFYHRFIIFRSYQGRVDIYIWVNIFDIGLCAIVLVCECAYMCIYYKKIHIHLFSHNFD